MPFVDYNPALDRQSCLAGHSQPDARIYLESSTGRRRCGLCVLTANRRKYDKRLGIIPLPIASRVKVDFTGHRFGRLLCTGLDTSVRGSNVSSWRLRCDCGLEVTKQNAVLTVAESTGKPFFCSQHCPYFIEFCRQRSIARNSIDAALKARHISHTPVHEPVPEPLKPGLLGRAETRDSVPAVRQVTPTPVWVPPCEIPANPPPLPWVKPPAIPPPPKAVPAPKPEPIPRPLVIRGKKFQSARGNTDAMPTSNKDSFPSMHSSEIGKSWVVVPLTVDPALDFRRYPTCDDDGDLSTSAIDKRATREHRRKLLAYPEPKESSPHEKIKDENKTQNSTQEKTDIICRAIFGNTHEKADSPA